MTNLASQTGFAFLKPGNFIMVVVALIFLYLAIVKQYEPLLLVPISFGMLLVNLYPPIMQEGGLLHYFYLLDEWSILPSLIFLGVGALTDFGPLIANPKSFLLGAAAQFGIYAAYFLAIFLQFPDKAAAAISIIGGADGPTSIFLAGKLGQTAYMGPIAVAAYSYMSLVPIIQPPIMKLLTTEEERKIKMEQLRPVSKTEKILFPIIVTIVVCLVLPTTAPLVGMLMLGNLFRESGVVKQLSDTASNALMYIVVIILGRSHHQCGSILKCEYDQDCSFRFSCILRRNSQWGLIWKINVQTDTWKSKSTDRCSWSICRTNGSQSCTESWGRRRFIKLPSDACNGTKRSRSYRNCSSSRNLYGNLRSLRKGKLLCQRENQSKLLKPCFVTDISH